MANNNRIDDSFGNVIFTEGVIYKPDLIDYFITPAGQRHRRPLSRLIKSEAIMIFERTWDVPVHKMHEGYHFNQHLLHSYPGGSESFNRVAVVEIDTREVFLADTKYILSDGRPQKQKRDGLAAQIFLHREWLTYYRLSRTSYLYKTITENSPNYGKT